jgi:DNA (cytosine-5)-methyltransferase 1
MNSLRRFLVTKKTSPSHLRAVSLFSGAGLSDYGYKTAGFSFVVQAEIDAYRASLGRDNFPESRWIVGDLQATWKDVVRTYREATTDRLDLLVATPPCQGMSSSNPSRGKRDTGAASKHQDKNSLILGIIPVAAALRPRLIVAENVRQILTLTIKRRGRVGSVLDVLSRELPDYHFFAGVVNVADYGIPQIRRRAIIVGVHETEPYLQELVVRGRSPWPKATHGASKGKPWVSVGKWISETKYERLDARSSISARGRHPLHYVPAYHGDRYLQIASIPRNTGRSAYQNDKCPDCGFAPVPVGTVRCTKCAALMRNRPYVYVKRKPRLIAGFKSSYRRMRNSDPAPTITTNFKIHPSENRVLSIQECADLQTVPRNYRWDRALRDDRAYTIRVVVGEAFPSYFTYLHGRILERLLTSARRGDAIKRTVARCETR